MENHLSTFFLITEESLALLGQNFVVFTFIDIIFKLHTRIPNYANGKVQVVVKIIIVLNEAFRKIPCILLAIAISCRFYIYGFR